MSARLSVLNRQRTKNIQRGSLQRLAVFLLRQLLGRESFALTIYLVDEPAMVRLNETHLGHAGSTDVITFDYTGPEDPHLPAGDLFICVDEALVQAKRFRTTWPSELVRYVVHGILHLSGYDDRTAAQRRRMKREEDRLLKLLARRYPFNALERVAR